MKLKGKFVRDVDVIDPDSKAPVTISVYKLESGGMIAVDSSFLEQEVGPVYSPFNQNIELELED